MIQIPLDNSSPSQVTMIVLNNQNCTIKLYQKGTGLYMDLSIDVVVIFTGAICQNNNPIANYTYLAFSGHLVFFDTLGESDPYYTGFGTRYQLLYLSPGEGVTS